VACHHSAVDRKDCARDPARRISREKHDGAHHVRHLAVPAQGMKGIEESFSIEASGD
jgi:hypothetical protein